jgi:hypothetical protein
MTEQKRQPKRTVTEEGTTKKQNRLDWSLDTVNNYYTVKVYFAESEVQFDLEKVFPGFSDLSIGRKELIKCGLREKVSQVHNQCISSYRKVHAKAIEAGTVEPLPEQSDILAAVESCLTAFYAGQWPTEVKVPGEKRVKVSRSTLVAELVASGIPADRANAIADSILNK